MELIHEQLEKSEISDRFESVIDECIEYDHALIDERAFNLYQKGALVNAHCRALLKRKGLLKLAKENAHF